MWMGFCVAMLFFMGVGIFSATRAKQDVKDYLVAGRSVSPVAAGLSAVASLALVPLSASFRFQNDETVVS